MPKTLPPGIVTVGTTEFRANVMPDVFDDRDLEYRPQLRPLKESMDARPEEHFVLTQEGNSCTGHAVASMINTVLATTASPIRVSPYMLYRMARRYDEFEGEEEEGSSLRGALKGWYYHGVLPTEDWPTLDMDVDIDLDPDLAQRALRHPLGAFYRVNAFRLDDIQSAVNELHAVAASALIHSGWIEPTRVDREDGTSYYLITRDGDIRQLGGHAFAIVGYNDVGFLVQNSWGAEWGAHGFATLSYEDWLTSAYDAWVARPGVPSVSNLRNSTKFVSSTAGGISQGPGPDLYKLRDHVVNLGNEGLLSTNGRFISTPAQIHRMFERMEAWHGESDRAAGSESAVRRVVLYAHGGLVNEGDGLKVAQTQLNWWLNNGVYPITFAWQSGPVETFTSQLNDILRDKLPFGGLGFDLVEQADRFVEKLARARLSWMWTQMKQNAEAASTPLTGPVTWPPTGAEAGSARKMPGGSLVANRLRHYADSLPDGQLEVHLVGHSAGAIFTAHLLRRLIEEGIRVTSVSWMAPAIRVDAFGELVAPYLRNSQLRRFVSFGLADSLELDDVVGTGKLSIYQKSLLYLVSRALESQGSTAEVPLFGLQRHADKRLAPASARRILGSLDLDLVWSPSESRHTSRTSATSHSSFDQDTATMTSVMLRILGLTRPTDECTFRPYAALAVRSSSGMPDAPAPEAVQVVNVEPKGSSPVSHMGAPQTTGSADDPPEPEREPGSEPGEPNSAED